MSRVVAAALLVMSPFAQAGLVVYDFEGFADSAPLIGQYAGLTFSHATVLSAGISLNEFEFPPASGSNVIFDDGGAITINFAGPVFMAGASFTYAVGLSFAVYDSNHTLLTTVSSSFSNNLALSGVVGSSPNEFLSFDSVAGRIARIVVTGDTAGGSFALDDLRVDSGAAMPEPGTLTLVAGLLVAGFVPGGWMRRRRMP